MFLWLAYPRGCLFLFCTYDGGSVASHVKADIGFWIFGSSETFEVVLCKKSFAETSAHVSLGHQGGGRGFPWSPSVRMLCANSGAPRRPGGRLRSALSVLSLEPKTLHERPDIAVF